jgi:hypothetical protein
MPKLVASLEKNAKESEREPDLSSQDLIEITSDSTNSSDCVEIGVIGADKPKKGEKEDREMDSIHGKISQEQKFDGYLFEAIDEVLTSLGAPVKNTLYFQLENSFNIPKSEIPTQIDEFTDILHKIFGLGASRLEIKFMKNLQSKIEANIKLTEYECTLSKWIVDDVSFTDYVHGMRKNYCTLQ